MKNLRIFIVIAAVILWTGNAFGATTFKNETLRYVISYKWGLIHKDAGEATLNLARKGDVYNVRLDARTKPWADHFYKVRDTLKASLTVRDLRPLSYAKITHEKGEYKLDEIFYSKSGDVTTGRAIRYRNSNGRMLPKEKTFSATGPVYDMLSVFYYLRSLDYSNLSNNKVYTATVFSGKQKETIKIRFLGIEKIKLKDKSERNAYHIKFNFTRDGGKKSSDDMDTWISTDSSHIPLYLVGKLPVGEIRAYFIGSD